MSSFSGLIVGETGLPFACAELLLREGHRLVGLCSPEPAAPEWANANGVPYVAPADLASFAAGVPFDYLFSIVNYAVLPASVLAAPRRAAINYHDALLPRYAGTYATSWAIMNREPVHGVTWHLMTDRVDAGDVLKQESVEIDPDDVAASLNVKCFYAALQSFGDLTAELADDRARPVEQDLTQRTYFSLYRRPPRGGMIAWQDDAAAVDAFVRALDFGMHRNPFATSKFSVDGRLFVAGESRILDGSSGAAPGTILAAEGRVVVVATGTNDVELTGTPIPSPSASALAVRPGMRCDAEDFAPLAEQYSRAARDESYWVRRLADLRWESASPEEAHDVALTIDTTFDPRHFASVVPVRVEPDADVDAAVRELGSRSPFPFDLFLRIPSLRGLQYRPPAATLRLKAA